jgi:GT2 family glycosyltransferase
MPTVSVVLLQFGLPHLTRVALDSIYKSDPVPDEIVMVDNGSSEEDRTWLRSEKVKLIESPTNLGYISGTNVGWKASVCDYILLCNNDIALSKQCIRRLVIGMERDKQIGWMTANYQCGGWSNSHVDFPSEVVDSLNRSTGEDQGPMNAWSETLGDTPVIEYYKATEGTVVIVRKSVSDEIGYYWDELKTGCHTHDYALKCRKAGYKVASCKNAVFYHSGNMPTIRKVWGREMNHADQEEAYKLMASRWGNDWYSGPGE